MTIQATQFIRPDGRKNIVSIERSPEIEALADKLRHEGFEFEIEVIGDWDWVSMEIVRHEEEEPIAGALVKNDSNLPGEVDLLITRAYKRFAERGLKR